MSTSTVYCYVLEDNISVVSDLKGNVTNVVCPQFNRITFVCNIKKQEKGFLTQVLSRGLDKYAGTKITHCEFADPKDSPLAKKMNPRQRR